MSIFPAIDDSLMIKKSNNLIRSKYNLSLIEQRIILIGISYIQDTQNKKVCIPVSDYKRLLNVQDFNYQYFVDVLKKLKEKSLITTKVNPDTGILEEGYITGWVESVHYKDGLIQLRFNEDIWEHLIELKEKYAEYQLSSVLTLKSKYSIRMYEILKSYAWIGYYTVSVDDIRDILMLGNKYVRFNDLEKVIIQPAINEINDNFSLDIRVSYTAIKTGRRYDTIKFVIHQASNNEIDENIPPEVQMAKNMSDIELFIGIKTLLASRYKVFFTSSDKEWLTYELYSSIALRNTYVALLSDAWKNYNITNYKSFFAKHLQNETKSTA